MGYIGTERRVRRVKEPLPAPQRQADPAPPAEAPAEQPREPVPA